MNRMNDKMRYVPKCIDLTGLREKPMKGEQEQSFHMTSVLHRLFPKAEWRCGKGLVDRTGMSVSKMIGKTLKPDFLSTELGLIVEIDGDSIGKVGGHFCSTEKAKDDIERTELFMSLGYRVIAIPPYIQLDAAMIHHYFGIDYPEKLYPAASEHGFAHPQISLPSMFCKLGADRFIKDMDIVSQSVREKSS